MNKIELTNREKIRDYENYVIVISIDEENLSYKFSHEHNRLKVVLITKNEVKEVTIQDSIDNIRLKIDKAFTVHDDVLYQGTKIIDVLMHYIDHSLRVELLGYDAL